MIHAVNERIAPRLSLQFSVENILKQLPQEVWIACNRCFPLWRRFASTVAEQREKGGESGQAVAIRERSNSTEGQSGS
jgi:hypothetical protein